MAERNTFIFHESYDRAMNNLTPYYRARVIEAIIAYGLHDQEPEGLEGIAEGVWVCIKDQIDADRRREEIIRDKRAKAGQKGGKKRVANIQANQANQANASKMQNNSELEANASFACFASPPHPPIINNYSSSYHACEEKEKEGPKEKLKRWIMEAGLLEQTDMVFYRKEQRLSEAARAIYVRKTPDEIVDQFYDFKYEVRELVAREDRSGVLGHYQNWLPKYIDTKISDAENAARNQQSNGEPNNNQRNQIASNLKCNATRQDI